MSAAFSLVVIRSGAANINKLYSMRLYHIATRSDFDKNGEKRRTYYKTGELYIDESNGTMFMRLYQSPRIRYYFFDTGEKLPEIDADTNTERRE
jgi:hypothetical protein